MTVTDDQSKEFLTTWLKFTHHQHAQQSCYPGSSLCDCVTVYKRIPREGRRNNENSTFSFNYSYCLETPWSTQKL